MIGFYIVTLMLSTFVLFFSPYIAASQYEMYSTTPGAHVTERSIRLASAIRWGVITVICTVTVLYSAWGLKDSIFSKLGYLC